MTAYKQAILIRKDLGMSRGKIASQAAHASLLAAMQSPHLSAWLDSGKTVIVLRATESEMRDAVMKDIRIPAAQVFDAGRTQVDAGTLTAVAIGPDWSEHIDKLVAGMKLL